MARLSNHSELASGSRPRRTKGNASLASWAAMRMSHCKGKVSPTPTAGPLMAANTGVAIVQGDISDIGGPMSSSLVAAPPTVLPARSSAGAGAERPPGAGDDDGSDLVGGVEGGEGMAEVAPHLGGVGVEMLGSIERHESDFVRRLDEDGLVFATLHATGFITFPGAFARRSPLGPRSAQSSPRARGRVWMPVPWRLLFLSTLFCGGPLGPFWVITETD